MVSSKVSIVYEREEERTWLDRGWSNAMESKELHNEGGCTFETLSITAQDPWCLFQSQHQLKGPNRNRP